MGFKIIYCIRCKNEISIPEFDTSEKEEILNHVRENLPLYAIQFVKIKKHLDLSSSKAFVQHLNAKKGICHRCNKEISLEENVVCSRCKSFNLNW